MSSTPPNDLNSLIGARRVMLCVGCGGVGKTTTCAALGLAAARQGKRVLCLTIDPARRLAQSLGLERLKTEAQHIEPGVFAAAGQEVSGSLTMMMLDTKSTFDSLVSALAGDTESRDAILNNRLYQYISTSLAGTQEYMAMEKLYAVKDDPRYDLILLDTPPTSHALDFLDAPQRLVDAIDSPAVRWFLQAFDQSGRFSLNLLARSAAAVLRGIGRIIGGDFLAQIANFVSSINDLFGGWRARAEKVATALRGDDVAYLLVTTSDRMCLREVLFFAQRLREQDMHPDAFVVNRVHESWEGTVSAADIEEACGARGLSLPENTTPRIVKAAQQHRRLAQLERLNQFVLEEIYDEDTPGHEPVLVRVPEFAEDIHDVTRLVWVADVLAP